LLARDQGEVDRARALFAEGLALAKEVSRLELVRGIEAIVDMLAADGQREEVLYLAGITSMQHDVMQVPLWPTERARIDAALAFARQKMSTSSADAAWAQGRSVPLGPAAALAIDMLGIVSGAMPKFDPG
jgi:hypothetical protein